MPTPTDRHDPWNTTLTSAAAGLSWRATVRHADADAAKNALFPDQIDRTRPFETLLGDRLTPTAPGGNDPPGRGFRSAVPDISDIAATARLPQPPPGAPKEQQKTAPDALAPGTGLAGEILLADRFAAPAIEPGDTARADAEADAQAVEPSPVIHVPKDPGRHAVPVAALPPDILQALQTGEPVRPLSPQGFSFPDDGPLPTAAAPGEAPAGLTPEQQADRANQRAALQAQTDRRLLDRAITDRPAGATASEGGWFSTVMLQALEKYEATRSLTGPRATPNIDVRN